MNTFTTLALIAHVLIAASIIGLVMLQRGKGADAGAGFGSGASGTVFGARGSANFLSRSTAVMAALFFATSLLLAAMNSDGNRKVVTSILDEDAVVEEGISTEVPEVIEADEFDLPPLPEATDSIDAESTDSVDSLPVVPE
ncbi:MAG: preprotein translocase subunit SecG [Gammaproteobacteria bacterium]|nr:preprotein translocase subunit SecG [Gammaproteobacteria bacterium]MCP4090007.1 preprotein translocase subunit SecG [Gammaproteobacteria bacterium]MCP4929303.1 preprotein translocase subunit SecG [Gammaproteobacteria bacterium]